MRSDSSPLYNDVYLYVLLGVVYFQYWTTCGFFVATPFWKVRHIIRLITCLSVGVTLYIPLFNRYFSHSTSFDPGLSLHSSAFHWLLISGIFMGVNFPECLAPGKFDYFFYGHQIFHLCIFMVTWNVCEGARIDAQYLGPEYLSFDAELFPVVMKILIFNFIGICATIWILVEYAKAKNDKKID
uniref:Uncharacterized protein n=1 Tax=Panagrolaimus sp. JU765 TaxID=591449 RepID=A0AC34RKC9_9BILA